MVAPLCHDPRMGRHGAGESSKRAARISLPLVVIGVLVLAAIGFGIWLWSVRSVTDPIDAHPVDAYAVVVTSPSCTSGSGTTVIDLDMPPTVRTSLSACGRRVGERLAVQYLAGHPEQVRLSGTTVAHNTALGRWLPIAILGAGLLAVVATIALMIDRRKSRHGEVQTRVTVAQLRAKDTEGEPVPSAYISPFGTLAGVGGVSETGRHATVRPAQVDAGPPSESDDPTAAAPAAAMSEAQDGPVTRDTNPDTNPDVTSRIAMPSAPQEQPIPFRPSEIAVEDDLFTHRGPEAPDR
jgi:hypothetical protein